MLDLATVFILEDDGVFLCYLAIDSRIGLNARCRYFLQRRRPMVEDIGELRSSRFAGRIIRRRRKSAYCYITLLKHRCTIVIKEGNLILRRRILQPSCTIDSIAGNGSDSRLPYKGMTYFCWGILADRHLIMRKELTLNLHTTFVLEDDGVHTRFGVESSRIGHIAGNRTERRRPTCEIVGIVDRCLTRRVGSTEFSHCTIGNAITILKFSICICCLDNSTIIVFPSDCEAFLQPFFYAKLVCTPLVICIIIGVDTVIEVILLLYFPPLAVIHLNEESSGTVCIGESMIGIAFDTLHVRTS